MLIWEIFLGFLTAGAAAIPIGIAVGRQRLQETTTSQSLPQIQSKDLNRFGLGLADLGESRGKHQFTGKILLGTFSGNFFCFKWVGGNK